ncbi:bacterio-opsin activator HTH domain-containing protein [Halodesulfurarchaeum formicicum]|uniref:Bacterio-opsin activator HTH domain-containing protein n=1 Tax=Halodesulfurarchaeum formicicum TaxID=1873524 RepID=A0A1D8S2R5_9EURY|nr:helix-turn-helix domain-containing protein [Halodesulfurarchaeum formicicum]AOW79621.1 bacterio-opsin activator HTH domain-containing protein [Halodesulfurarchaeum formicicum]APE94872.1 bacterio-opsin activator HTH domain-containing protein [Halodesulfurarchaeum formicicum]
MVEIALEFGTGTKCCAARGLGTPIEHHLIDDTCYVTCRSPDSDSELIHDTVPVDMVCACRVLASHGCIPSLESIDSERMVVRTNPENRRVLRELMADLDDIADSVGLRSLVVNGAQSDSDSALVNLQELTVLERETVEAAILAGYYDRSGGAGFGDLARDLAITKSALSKRLSSAEAKIMRNLYRNE